MSAVITFDFGGGSAANSPVFVDVANGEFVVSADVGLTAAFSTWATNISFATGQVAIGTGLGAQFKGTLAAAIDWSPPQVPTVTLNNLINPPGSPATVRWTTKDGPLTEKLTPGEPMDLTGIVASSE